MSLEAQIFSISLPFTLPAPLGVPKLTWRLISIVKLLVIEPNDVLDALFVASLIDSPTRQRLDIIRTTRNRMIDFTLFRVTYLNAFLNILFPPLL